MKGLVAGTVLLVVAGVAATATTVGEPPTEETLAAGRAVAAGAGGQDQAVACFNCHGFDGGSQVAAAFPALAGLPARYMEAQLRAYASGERQNGIMQPIARRLSEPQMRSVSAYYAAQPLLAAEPRAGGDPALLQRGGVLAATGSAEIGVQACQNCHGPAGVGVDPLYPRLLGQPAGYLAAQLRAWRSGMRAPDPRGTMATIARSLGDQDIEAVSLYYASIRLREAGDATGVVR
jgi:cytochrome c553